VAAEMALRMMGAFYLEKKIYQIEKGLIKESLMEFLREKRPK
jgi:hypothetical protein